MPQSLPFNLFQPGRGARQICGISVGGQGGGRRPHIYRHAFDAVACYWARAHCVRSQEPHGCNRQARQLEKNCHAPLTATAEFENGLVAAQVRGAVIQMAGMQRSSCVAVRERTETRDCESMRRLKPGTA
jgi:hypothetical protein